jgi:polyisoprenoid-binding protein YceI
MTFASTRIEQTGEGTVEVPGGLALLGVTRPIVLDATLDKLAPSSGHQ